MATVSNIGNYFTIRMDVEELTAFGFSLNSFDTDAFIDMLCVNSMIKQFVAKENETGIHLIYTKSEINDSSIIFALCPVEDECMFENMESIHMIAEKDARITDTYREELNFLVSCMDAILNDNFEDECTEGECSNSCEYKIAGETSLLQKLLSAESNQDRSDVVMLSPEDYAAMSVLDSKAPYPYLSFETCDGKQLLWFYKKIQNLGCKDIHINAFIANGTFHIIIPCNKLLMKHCMNVLWIATESGFTMRPSLSNISLLEHTSPMTEEMIVFVGENEIVLRGKR